MLAILIESEYFADKPEQIIDEMIGVVMAGVKTSQATQVNLIQYMITLPDIRQRVLDEINPKFEAIKDDFRGKLTWDILDTFEYTKNCFYETLRIAPPAPMSGTLCFDKDVVIKGIEFRAGMAFWLNFTEMHHCAT